jgi:hypothetical protein
MTMHKTVISFVQQWPTGVDKSTLGSRPSNSFLFKAAVLGIHSFRVLTL